MRIEVSGKQFVFPRSCACCGTYATSYLEVQGSEKNQLARTKGWAWDIPYCLTCRKHVKRSERLQVFSLALASLGIAGGFIAGFIGGWQTGITVAVLGVVFVAGLSWATFRWLRSSCHQNCWGLSRSVLYLGSNRDCHAFDIKDIYFAEAFILANHRKIVNASPRVAGVLRNTEFGNFQVARRLLRRRQRS